MQSLPARLVQSLLARLVQKKLGRQVQEPPMMSFKLEPKQEAILLVA